MKENRFFDERVTLELKLVKVGCPGLRWVVAQNVRVVPIF
jgi:hypothetical protein